MPRRREADVAQRRGIDDGPERRSSAGSWSAKRGARRAGAGVEGWRLCGVGRRNTRSGLFASPASAAQEHIPTRIGA